MKKTTILAILPVFLFIWGCKKQVTTDLNSLKPEDQVFSYLNTKLSKATFDEIDKSTLQMLPAENSETQKAIVYFKKNGNNNSKLISVAFENGNFKSEIIDVKINLSDHLNSYTVKRTSIESGRTTEKTSSINNQIKIDPKANDLQTDNGPIELQEIIVVGKIKGQGSFIIQAFIRGLIDALNYTQVYFNAQNQSLIHPSDYDDYGFPFGVPEVRELEFESPEEAAAFQQWLTEITPAELALCMENPVAALQIYRNSRIALKEFPGWNGLADAQRHAFWMALNAKDPLVGPNFATRFGIAHETGGIPSTLVGKPFGHQQWQLEIKSDIHNNNAGIKIIDLMKAAGWALTIENIRNWINTYATPGGDFLYLCDPTPFDPGSGDEVLRYSNQSCP